MQFSRRAAAHFGPLRMHIMVKIVIILIKVHNNIIIYTFNSSNLFLFDTFTFQCHYFFEKHFGGILILMMPILIILKIKYTQCVGIKTNIYKSIETTNYNSIMWQMF